MKTQRWTLKGIDVSVVNSLRRIILSEIPNVAFDDIEVLENTSDYHNEFVSHRVSMVPVCFDEAEIDDWTYECSDDAYEFVLDVCCPEDTAFRNVYARDIEVYRRGQICDNLRLFPENPYSNSTILLLKLRPAQRIRLRFRAKLSTAKRSDCRWSPVSLCYHRCVGEDAFEFEIETECALSPAYIMRTALEILHAKLAAFVGDVRDDTTLKCSDISASEDADAFYTVRLKLHDATTCSVFQRLLVEDACIDFASFHRPHPLQPDAILKIGLSPKGRTSMMCASDVYRHLTNIDVDRYFGRINRCILSGSST